MDSGLCSLIAQELLELPGRLVPIETRLRGPACACGHRSWSGSADRVGRRVLVGADHREEQA